MAMQWSYGVEALMDARDNLENCPEDFLRMAWAEIQGTRSTPDFDHVAGEARCEEALARAEHIPSDILADGIWEWAETERTCSGDFHEVYVCPYGCHRVSVDGRVSEEEFLPF